MNFEIVHTITNYWDGPREGIADYRGKPHLYESVFEDTADEWSDVFLLQPVDDEIFRLSMEDWAIWQRWEHAFHSGQTTLETHPALPEERNRHEEIMAILTPKLKSIAAEPICVTGKFHVPPPGIISSSNMMVIWSQCSEGKQCNSAAPS